MRCVCYVDVTAETDTPARWDGVMGYLECSGGVGGECVCILVGCDESGDPEEQGVGSGPIFLRALVWRACVCVISHRRL